jgi:hypothetical protein
LVGWKADPLVAWMAAQMVVKRVGLWVERSVAWKGLKLAAW